MNRGSEWGEPYLRPDEEASPQRMKRRLYYMYLTAHTSLGKRFIRVERKELSMPPHSPAVTGLLIS